ncbi:ABC transporter substrate-binding protein [Phytohabitans sp. ZYX-F-186]|uniref:ABC transporter substrate-binding protein n=1 Tax=Phytohabitans maris TaxID=3071409 RepID=A0ABU0ZGA9_9ACTN|nr:ABC transporter substrate-binding protein [Phytohabitans sp. ZYX-F-186]MDQ7906093.1 ABC transporter substrate-binding protein [Phytohabitans sp. ZYX-F-186]
MRRPQLLAAAGLALALAATSACSDSDDGGGSGANGNFASGGTFTFAVAGDPGTLNPLNNTATTANWLFRFLYQPLVVREEDGSVGPGLATKWDFDGTKAVFTIDPNATCSDGSKITPSVIAKNFAWVKEPKNTSTVIGATLPNRDFTFAADDAAGTFTLTLNGPFSNLLPSLSFMHQACGAGADNPAGLTTSSSGSGPFVLKTATPNSEYVMTKRDGFPGNDAAGVPDQVVMKIVDSESTAANLLLSGAINAAVVNGQDRARLTAAGATEKTYTSGGVVVSFNHREGRITADKAVRVALTQALDRGPVAKVVTQGLLPEAGTSVSAAQPQICDDSSAAAAIPSFDTAAAEATLTADGWTKGGDGVLTKGGKQLTFQLGYSTATPGAAAAAELMADAFGKIGAKATISPFAQADYTQRVFSTGDYDVMLQQFSNPFPSTLIGLLAGPFPPDGTNAGHVANKTYADAVAAARTATTQEAACQNWTAASKALFEEADMIPIASWPTNWVVKNAVMETLGGRPIAESVRLLQPK